MLGRKLQGSLIKDLSLPKTVEILIQPDQIVVSIVSPTILEETTPGEIGGKAAAEPEVISKGKKEEVEEGEAATPVAGAKKEAGASTAKKEEKK